MQRLAPSSLALLLVAGVVGTTGCDNRLTPEKVRELLDHPQGAVSNETMARATRDLFLADKATAVESFASILKTDQGAGDSSNALPGVSTGVFEDVGDAFCVGGLVTSIATFDACEIGDACNGEITLDSCILRVGDEGADEDARGKIKFKLENSIESAFDRSALSLDFEGWESSRDDALLDTFAGAIALETTRAHDDSSVELVFASDLDVAVKRKERGLFDDGIEEETNVSAGLRFQAAQDASSAQGSLEVLAFVDEDGSRTDSVTIRMAAEGHRVDAKNATASASLEVIGENGTFACSWSGAEESASRDGVKVSSSGECVDEDGESFSFSGEAESD